MKGFEVLDQKRFFAWLNDPENLFFQNKTRTLIRCQHLQVYDNLKTNIASYLARTDLTEQIPMFISLAEKRLNRDLRLRQTLQQSTYTMPYWIHCTNSS